MVEYGQQHLKPPLITTQYFLNVSILGDIVGRVTYTWGKTIDGNGVSYADFSLLIRKHSVFNAK